MKRQLTAFKQLVSFISNMKDMRISSEINPLIAQALEVSVKTVETIGKTRMLTSSEILVVVDVLIKIAEDKTDESKNQFQLLQSGRAADLLPNHRHPAELFIAILYQLFQCRPASMAGNDLHTQRIRFRGPHAQRLLNADQFDGRGLP